MVLVVVFVLIIGVFGVIFGLELLCVIGVWYFVV